MNGQDAYEIVHSTIMKKETMFDVIILDLNMPVTDGYEACEII